MDCQQVDFNSPDILKIYALRQKELRLPLNLNLFNEDLLVEQDEVFLAGYENKQLVTCLQFRALNDTTLKLRQMATHEEYKGRGYGKALVRFGEQWALQNGFKQIELHARKIAQGFYEKLAYKQVGGEFLEVNIPHYKMKKILKP